MKTTQPTLPIEQTFKYQTLDGSLHLRWPLDRRRPGQGVRSLSCFSLEGGYSGGESRSEAHGDEAEARRRSVEEEEEAIMRPSFEPKASRSNPKDAMPSKEASKLAIGVCTWPEDDGVALAGRSSSVCST